MLQILFRVDKCLFPLAISSVPWFWGSRMRNPFLYLFLVTILQSMRVFTSVEKRDLHGQQDSKRSDGWRGVGGKETFNFAFNNLLKYFDYECWTPYWNYLSFIYFMCVCLVEEKIRLWENFNIFYSAQVYITLHYLKCTYHYIIWRNDNFNSISLEFAQSF